MTKISGMNEMREALAKVTVELAQITNTPISRLNIGQFAYWYDGKIQHAFKPDWLWRIFWFLKRHRLAYCQGYTCYHATGGTGVWTLCREQVFARSTSTAWMCEECADEEQQEVDAAWAEYYGGLL